MGDVTITLVLLHMIMKIRVFFGINLRYPEGFEFEKAMDRFANQVNNMALK